MTTQVRVDKNELDPSQHSFFTRLYTGEGGIDFVGRRKLWYIITLVVLAVYEQDRRLDAGRMLER